MGRIAAVVIALFAGSALRAGEYALSDPGGGSWFLLLSEFARSADMGVFVVLVVLLMTIGLAIDAFCRVRISKLIPEDLLAVVQEEMAVGEYEKALDACLKADCLAGQIFAAVLSKTDHSFERMEGAMRSEARILGLIWRQWVGQFRLLALVSVMAGVLSALLGGLRFVADLPGRPNLALAFASSFETRAFLYCIVGSLFLGVASAAVALAAHYFCLARLERILLEADRLGEEILDAFRPLPLEADEGV